MKARACSIALAAIAGLAACSPSQPSRRTWAVVVSIAPPMNPKWHPDEVVITARTLGGVTGSASVAAARLACRAGDTIPVVVSGIALKLTDHACQR